MIVRFMEESLRHTSPKGQGKYAPSVSTVMVGIFALCSHLHFKFKDWKFSSHIKSQVQSWINLCIDEKRLIRGVWRPRRFITFHIFRKLMTSWFEDVFRCGTPGFDVDLSRILPVATMVAVDCRVGDCVATDTHAAKKEMYMKLKDIELTL
jgi:hypothetical protein